MEFLDNLIKTSLLGTERQSLDKALIPDAILPYLEAIEEKSLDKEDRFLKSAALLINYYNSGKTPEKVSFNLPKPAEEEVLPYCNERSTRALQSVLDEALSELLEYWLKKCIECKLVITPENLVPIIEEGKRNIKIRNLIKEVIGKRGTWLAQFNEEWKFITITEQEIWETGKPEERKQLLIQLRNTHSEQAKSLLSSSWKEENAITRAELLSIFSINLSKEDEDFLYEALKDNSLKVKSIAQELLSQIAGSKWIEELWGIGSSWVTFKASKNILQFTKEEMEVDVPVTFPPELKKKGLQELSSNKELSDQQYWLLQFVTLIPPSFFEEHFKAQPSKIITLFSKDKFLQKVIPGFILATIRHKDQKWAKVLLEEKLNRNEHVKITSLDELYHIFDLLAPEEKKYFYDKNLEKKDFPFKLALIDFLNAFQFDWDFPFTIKALKDLTAESQEGFLYSYPKLVTLSQFAHTGILESKKEVEPKDETSKDKWNTLFARFFKVLEIRKEIDEGFRAN
ncbi:MAG TPA: DUF5691 domain-containing protein [Cytophagales bacterium]|nr:DUF5691 domain-containing protein [Cytophagales bacterium]